MLDPLIYLLKLPTVGTQEIYLLMLVKLKALFNKYRILCLFITRLVFLLFALFALIIILESIPGVRDQFVNSRFIYWFMKSIAFSTTTVLNLFGYPATFYYSYQFSADHGLFAVRIPPGNGMYVGIRCLAFTLISLFTILIISFPGKILTRVVYIILGFLVIQVMNVARFCYLVVASKSISDSAIPDSLQLTTKLVEKHHDIFNLIVYFLIVILFIIYVKYFSKYKSFKKLS